MELDNMRSQAPSTQDAEGAMRAGDRAAELAEFEGLEVARRDAATDDTAIDRAWRRAQDAECCHDASEADAAAAEFIDTLLAEPLICPIDEPPSDEENALFRPTIVQRDGCDTVLAFDTEERLAEYVDAPTSFVALPGRTLFALAAGRGAQIALNPTVASSDTLFNPQTVDAIASLIEASEEDVAIAADTAGGLEITAPGDASEALMTALSARLAAARAEVVEAWLFRIEQLESGGESASAETDAASVETNASRLVLGLLPSDDGASDSIRNLAGELGRLSGALLQDDALDIAIFAPSDRMLEAARRCGFGLVSGAPSLAVM